MKTKIVVPTSALALLVLLGAGRGPSDDDEFKTLEDKFAKAIGFPIEPLRRAKRTPDPASERQVAKLTETPVEAFAEADYFKSDLVLPDDGGKVPVTFCRLPFGEDEKVLVCVDRSGLVAGAAVLDAEDVPRMEWRTFLTQFVNDSVFLTADAKSPSHLAAILARGERAEDEEGRLLGAILHLRAVMHAQMKGELRDALAAEALDAEREAMLAGAAARFRGLLGLKDPLAPLLGESAADFEAIATALADGIDEMKVALREGRRDDARAASEAIGKRCGSCHGMKPSPLVPAFQQKVRARREELGLTEGYYAVGHDLILFDEDPAEAREIAAATRNAILLASKIFRYQD